MSRHRKHTHERREKPDHFISLQISDPEIHRVIGEIQDHIISQTPNLKKVAIPLSTLHVTLMVMALGKEYSLDRITEAMSNCRQEIQQKCLTPLTLDIEGLGHFRNTILFAKIAEGPGLERLKAVAEVVRRCFTACDMPSTEDRELQAHLTVMKLSKEPSLWRKGIKKIDASLYEKYVTQRVGSETVTSLQLCSMDEPKDSANGYYAIVHQVPLDSLADPVSAEVDHSPAAAESNISTLTQTTLQGSALFVEAPATFNVSPLAQTALQSPALPLHASEIVAQVLPDLPTK